jgi:hypothetical protein
VAVVVGAVVVALEGEAVEAGVEKPDEPPLPEEPQAVRSTAAAPRTTL